MSLLGPSKFLGLSVGDGCILAAQVRVSGEGREVGPMGRFDFPPGMTWDKPEAVGAALQQFLRHNHFSASKVVVGVPARWLMAREKELPPATAQNAASMLRLQAERDFSQDLELVCEYTGVSDAAKPSRVLLVAITKGRLDRITRMAEEAGLSLLAVTSSTLALVLAAKSASDSVLSVVIGPDSAELIYHGQTAPRMLKYVSIPAGVKVSGNGDGGGETLVALGTEVRRAVALMPREGENGNFGGMFLWDGVGLTADAAAALGDRSGLRVRVGADLPSLGATVSRQANGDARELGPAVALALSACRAGGGELDFLHTRLVAPKKRRIGRPVILAGVAGLMAIAGISWLMWDIGNQQKMLDGFRQQLLTLKPGAKSAQAVVDKVRFARGWFETRPPYLDCVRDATLAFPLESATYATAFSFRENGKGQLTGKAPDQKSALSVMERIKANKAFSDVKLLDMHDASGRSREIAFSISFTYNGVE